MSTDGHESFNQVSEIPIEENLKFTLEKRSVNLLALHCRLRMFK